MSTPDDAASAAAAQETTGANGKPDGELEAKSGESKGNAQDVAGLEKSYKELQSKFSKTTERVKELEATESKLGKYGGADKLLAQVEALLGDEEFTEWAKQRQRKTDYGINPDETDAETQSALKLVEKIATATTQKAVDSAVKELEEKLLGKISPMSTEYAAERMDRLLDGLDDKYGDSWHEVRGTLADLIQNDASFPEMPTAEDMEDALLRALRKEGKLQNVFSELSKRELTAKKELATETPGTRRDAKSETKYKTIQEAYEAAKREHAQA